jgi:CheY-like chemotaxis protein/anti-sigma regulatory factor (Ser/Thr protein kinase)
VAVVARIRSYSFEQAGLALEIDDIPEDLCVVGDAQRLQQVLMNLVENSFDALVDEQAAGNGGTRRGVRIRALRRDDDVDVLVEDDGPGFPDPDRSFEPFYTTKPVGEGTGLGLTLVHGFMEEFGGQVRAENRRNGGARVVLTFRRVEPCDRPGVTPRTAPVATLDRSQPLRVLVVEDEEALRTLQARLLRRVGATVELAAGGEEARTMLEHIDVDLVITDVKMPDGSGLDLYAWATRERPDLTDRFLFVTGDVGDEAIAEFSRRRPDRFLSKPFHADDYVRRVAAIIDDTEI